MRSKVRKAKVMSMWTVSSSTLRTAAAALLATTAGAFAFANVSVVTTGIDTSPVIVTGAVNGEAASSEEAGLIMPEPPQSLTETTARPVFFADRKPIVSKPTGEPAQEIQDPSAASMQLLGTVRPRQGQGQGAHPHSGSPGRQVGAGRRQDPGLAGP